MIYSFILGFGLGIISQYYLDLFYNNSLKIYVISKPKPLLEDKEIQIDLEDIELRENDIILIEEPKRKKGLFW